MQYFDFFQNVLYLINFEITKDGNQFNGHEFEQTLGYSEG